MKVKSFLLVLIFALTPLVRAQERKRLPPVAARHALSIDRK